MTVAPTTQEAFGQAFSAALGSIDADARASFSVPVAISYDAMTDVFEAATGMSVGDFIYGTVADLVAIVVAEASAGELLSFIEEGGAAFGEALGEAASALGGVLDMIPMVGSFVTTIINVLDEYEAAEEQRLARIEQAKERHCRNVLAAARPLPTGPGGETTPADLFRQLADQTGAGVYGMPYNAAFAFALLCGGQTRGPWTFPPRLKDHPYTPPGEPAYQKWIAYARQLFGPQIGIDAKTRRTMWTLLEGIMAARRPYTLEHVEPLGDQGRVLFPMLCDIVLHEYQVKRTWTPEFVQFLFYHVDKTCGERIQLGQIFTAMLMQWKNTVQPAGYTDWLAKAKRDAELVQRNKLGLVSMSPRRVASLLGKTSDNLKRAPSVERIIEPPPTAAQALALGAGVAGIGYASWTAMRRWGPRARRR